MFKIGDIVECINDMDCAHITRGCNYKLRAVGGRAHSYKGMVEIEADNGCFYYYPCGLFKRVSRDVEEQREELEEALRIIHKYGCVATYTFKKGYNKNCNIYSRDFKPTIETFVENVFNDHEPVKTPAQIEAEEIAEQMKKLEERLKELSKSL